MPISEFHTKSAPQQWDLYLRVSSVDVSYLLRDIDSPERIDFGTLPIARTAEPYIKRLEDIFYDHEGLVNDYHSCTILIDNVDTILCPTDIASDEQMAKLMLKEQNRTFSGDVLSVQIDNDTTLLSGVQMGLLAFFQRSYYMPTLTHSFVPLIRQFSTPESRLNVTIIRDKVYIIGSDRHGLSMVNALPLRAVDTTAYYVLNAWQSNSYDQLKDELFLSGDVALLDKLQARLKQYIQNVMPAVLPTNILNLSADARGQIPLDLLLQAFSL